MKGQPSIDGLGQLTARLSKLSKVASPDQNRQAQLAGARVVKKWARFYVRVDTGHLQSTIEERIEGDDVIVSPDTPYARRIEYEVEPYMRPALDNHKTEVVKAITEELQKQIKQAVK